MTKLLCNLLHYFNIIFFFNCKKETWVGVLHHVCGEHTWPTGQCKHDPLGDESAKKYLEKNSKAMAALRKIVLDPKWLSSLHFYVKFR